jgi:hypothetical protein
MPYVAEAAGVAQLPELGRLCPDLDVTACDVLWAPTGRDLYRMLGVESRWNADRH